MGVDQMGWAQFGLAGVVVGALFVVLFVVVRSAIDHIAKMHETHRDERQEWRKADERRDAAFRGWIAERDADFRASMKELVEEFRRSRD